MNQNFLQSIVNLKKEQRCSLPDSEAATAFVTNLFVNLFICKNGATNNEAELLQQFNSGKETLQKLLLTVLSSEESSEQEAALFFETIPELYKKLLIDANALYEADPAAKSINEIFLAYPGFFAIAIYRIAHQLHLQNIPLIPRIISEFAHSKTGIDIHPGAKIGASFSIDHGTGIVIGETTTIGQHVKIYQGVTLGALTVVKENASTKRHPTIEDNVVIYSNATILGGETVIGHDSIIGGNVWLTKAIPAFSIVYQKAEVTIRENKKSITK